MDRFTDFLLEQDSEGIFDAEIDLVTGDFKVIDGLDTCEVVSLFTDRRARADEVADPRKRRGWIGDLVSDLPDDRIGSGLWLYEQRRLTPDVTAGVRFEAEAALRWQVNDGIAKTVTATVAPDPAKRSLSLIIETKVADGGVSSRVFTLVNATRQGLLARI